MTRKFSIEVSDTTAADLNELVNFLNGSACEYNTHGRLTISGLLKMLAEDAAMVLRRPGSWEGSNMAQVLSSHGYEF
ncbi:hypothetical protein [Burkholderia diffusa]|uniref:hypothetical protein n=1 Tax=Burkholderia diffusa TaxID=488732 RepID=UPI002AB25CB5|nr:hypothetical protein [Burkholderia diffusa]